MPFTPSPSQHSLPFPAFSFPLSFLLPFSCFSQHLHVLLLLSFFSRGFLESSACCGCLAGGRTFSRFLVGLKVPICHPGQNYHLAGLGSAWQTAMLSMRAKFQGQLSMGNFTLLGCFQSNTPSGLSTDAQRRANKWLKGRSLESKPQKPAWTVLGRTDQQVGKRDVTFLTSLLPASLHRAQNHGGLTEKRATWT